ncbi:CHASE2 domain-containing protein [Vogesella oryzae]|uniref:CHASE2 domain-containing protein n=1 Tax=Vogesella oryzae TaxID=1735285 RepID=UPI001582F1F2|nr:CHASE2 domain-containing protein [Vogesella oryzae]
MAIQFPGIEQSQNWLRRWLVGSRGQPVAALLLVAVLLLQLGSELPLSWQQRLPAPVLQTVQLLASPLSAARGWLFDSYQLLSPRQPRSQPVTIVAIDEKSLKQLGQWPWPRDRLAALVRSINAGQPAAIGLDIYMPEADQSSPAQLAARLPAAQQALGKALRALPDNDQLLAEALRQAPAVLGAAGFDYRAYTTREGLHSVPLLVQGNDPLPYVRNYPHVLASLPVLQAAGQGQALLSMEAHNGSVRRLALLAGVSGQLVPSMALEMFRVGSGASRIGVQSGPHGIRALQVADLTIPTLGNGEIYLHYAPLAAGMQRYVSAVDVLNGQVDAAMLRGKLVLLGLTGSGLNDMHYTALQELVPGTEIQAQLMEALFDGDFLQRPWWFIWGEVALAWLLGGLLLWQMPREDRALVRQLKLRPQLAFGLVLLLALLLAAAGLALFHFAGLLFDAVGVSIAVALVMITLILSNMIASLADARMKLASLVESGIAQGKLHQRAALLRTTLEAGCEITCCDGAAVLLKDAHNNLHFAQHTYPAALPEQALPLSGDAGRTVPGEVVSRGQSLFIDDLASESGALAANTRELLATAGIRAHATLAVPMRLSEGDIIGVMLLFNARDTYSKALIPFDRKLLPFMEALAAQAAVAIENQNLVEAQKNLMDAMIKIIAGAIDTKSPYTGGHCERVPELAIMLAQAACEQNEGPLADFNFRNDDEWREFHIGAWLHDCGKVTTPEYVVDKATKLETIYNRLHEIRTRFEVLLRDARLERWQAIYLYGEQPSAADARLAAREAQLQDDFAFIAECNQGGEFMAPERVARLQQLAEQTWVRHFDDRLGLSAEEQLRCANVPPSPLPAEEKLLADKPQHLFERLPSKAFDAHYGFKLTVPQYLYNQGEVYNLCVSRGTLTEEERFKINEHIIQTIVMLEQMPLPKYLKRVPEYAGTHHETLIGTGYPRQLAGDELSVPARIMAIADIFEALTASDRPYKPAKTLSEAIQILSGFKQRQHIDPVLFDLFLTSGVYLQYARRFLQPEQIDEVDIARYLG